MQIHKYTVMHNTQIHRNMQKHTNISLSPNSLALSHCNAPATIRCSFGVTIDCLPNNCLQKYRNTWKYANTHILVSHPAHVFLAQIYTSIDWTSFVRLFTEIFPQG